MTNKLYTILMLCLIRPSNFSHTHTAKNTQRAVLTIQILSAVDVEVIFPPYVDHGCIFLHQGWIGILKQEQHPRWKRHKHWLWSVKWFKLCIIMCKAETVCVKLSGFEIDWKTHMKTQKHIIRKRWFIDSVNMASHWVNGAGCWWIYSDLQSLWKAPEGCGLLHQMGTEKVDKFLHNGCTVVI